jgi:DNA-binding SARP family transcriptional activator
MVANTTSRQPTTIHLCGGPYVTVGSRRIEVPEGSKRVLAYAALRGCSIERRQIAGALWPYGDDNRAGGNLRSALWRLRGVGIDVIDADKWSISMQSDVHVDVTEICQWAGRLVSSRAIEADLTGWQDSVNALDLLPGWYDDWVIMERERVRQRLLHALEALCRLLAERGAYAEAVEAAMLAVDAEPLRESAQRALVEVHLAEGNVVEARRVYLAYRDLVISELRVEPSADLTRYVAAAGGRRIDSAPAIQHAQAV